MLSQQQDNMDDTALCIRLLLITLLLLAAHVHHNKAEKTAFRIIRSRLQLFEYESMSFTCEGIDVSAGWKVRNKNELTTKCSYASVASKVIFTIDYTYVPDSGEYWCESVRGKKSNTVNITVTAGSVILESPLYPVMEGDDVTLRCRNKMSLFTLTADFYKDDVLISCSDTGYMTIHSVSKSDEGLYKCNISGAGESPVSWLNVVAGAVILESPIHPVMEGDTVRLRCRKKTTPTNHIADFYSHGSYIGTGYNGEMTINSVSKSNEGPLKCSISGAGESAERWLTVTVSVILESPVLPVIEGEPVTMHCRNKMTTNTMANFYKDGIFIGSSFTGNLTIHSITKSDEGHYKCNISGGRESAENRLTVRECPNKSIQLCSDQLPVLLYLFIRTVATIIWVALLLLVLKKRHSDKWW